MLISVLKLLFRASLSDEEKQARYILLLDTHAKRIWIVTWDRAAGRAYAALGYRHETKDCHFTLLERQD